MPREEEIRSALASVPEPELGRPIGELGMIESVSLRRRRTVVSLAVPLAESVPELRRRVTEVLAPLVDVVEVDVRPMEDRELAVVAAILKGETPRGPLAVVDAAAGAPPRARTNPFTDARTRVLAVSSGKGGVGKSSVTTNLSVALAARGHRVAAVDADVWGFSMPRMLGIDRPPSLIDDVIVPPSAHGVRLISMGFFAHEDQAVVWRGPMLHKALEQFLTDVHWGEPDYLLVDMPPGTGDVALSISQFLPRAEVVIVTTPQPAAQKVAQRAAAMAEKVNLPVLGVVENMSWFRADDGKVYEIFGRGGGEELARDLSVPLLGRVPLVPALREGGDAGRPIVIADPGSEAACALVEIATRIDTELASHRVHHPELRLREHSE